MCDDELAAMDLAIAGYNAVDVQAVGEHCSAYGGTAAADRFMRDDPSCSVHHQHAGSIAFDRSFHNEVHQLIGGIGIDVEMNRSIFVDRSTERHQRDSISLRFAIVVTIGTRAGHRSIVLHDHTHTCWT